MTVSTSTWVVVADARAARIFGLAKDCSHCGVEELLRLFRTELPV